MLSDPFDAGSPLALRRLPTHRAAVANAAGSRRISPTRNQGDGPGTAVAEEDVLRETVLLLGVAAMTAACGPHLPRLPEGSLDRGAAPTERAQRLARVAGSLGAALPADTRVSVSLVDRKGLGAWAWRDGRIRVTPGLVDLLDDDELAAAVAHELGHLLGGGHVGPAPSSLTGPGGEPGEQQADAIGCGLLAASGRSPQALRRMLQRLGQAMGGDFAARAAAAATGPCAPR